DPFGLTALRAATLESWRSSPTRMAEDAAAERELSDIGYRGRLLTELAANAADAAADGDGRLAITLDGWVLRFANTGAPLTRDGVESLTALRVSPKPALGGPTVGHFGVGFRSTAFADRVQISSTSGAVEFDRQRSIDAVRSELGLSEPVPAQRLAWPSDAVPPRGFTTEVSVDAGRAAADLYAGFADQAPDLLLELPALSRIDIGDESFERRADGDHVSILRDGTVVARWLVARAGANTWMAATDPDQQDDSIVPLSDDVLRSPTATGVHLALPARVITGLPLTPDRRDVHPDADIASAAAGYTELVALAPDDQKHRLIPRPTLSAGRTGAPLHERILADLAVARWVPTVSGDVIAPERAWVLPGLPDRLGSVLADVLDPLAHPDVSDRQGAAALVRLGARQIGLADLADELSGVRRPPSWWQTLYAALAILVQTGDDAAELGALAIPRADGRTHRGARGLFVLDGLVSDAGEIAAPEWLPLVHPDAYDPLLDRLGLEHCSIADALADPALIAAIDTADTHEDLSTAVLDLVVLGDLDETSGLGGVGLGALELRADDGEDWPADELLLPDAPLRGVLVADSPFGSVAPALVARYGPKALRAIGVGWGFAVVHDDLPTRPDHDLPDEEAWWDGFDAPPETVDAVRDLDLVDPDRWREALTLLADDATAPLLAAGYTRWWLRRYAEIDGTALRHLRAVDHHAFAGLFDALDDAPPAAAPLLVADRPDDADDAQVWLDRLGDTDRDVAPGVAARAHAAVVGAVRAGLIAVDDIQPPEGARTLAGTVTDAPIVVDRSWWTFAVPADRAVLPGPTVDPADAAILADALDADLASQTCHGVPMDAGETVDADSAEIVALAATTGHALTGRVVVHRRLTVAVVVDGDEHRVDVPYWVDDTGTVHVSIAS
ncbi:sacsin N-terminal ATP-binding-like domain-containing protein, partial [Gordonia sp. (in: high G+C Gram-positive bacteria)]|uniref:sacsin N-terminal ATP-binding-like domain-containing protein n=1 Tax=Gordonia sp. (in: high G+C Gram-positive bacteria) TaxID=84139 RepID=UPI003F994D86